MNKLSHIHSFQWKSITCQIWNSCSQERKKIGDIWIQTHLIAVESSTTAVEASTSIHFEKSILLKMCKHRYQYASTNKRIFSPHFIVLPLYDSYCAPSRYLGFDMNNAVSTIKLRSTCSTVLSDTNIFCIVLNAFTWNYTCRGTNRRIWKFNVKYSWHEEHTHTQIKNDRKSLLECNFVEKKCNFASKLCRYSPNTQKW